MASTLMIRNLGFDEWVFKFAVFAYNLRFVPLLGDTSFRHFFLTDVVAGFWRNTKIIAVFTFFSPWKH